MPFNGTGTFARNYSWTNDANNGINISATRMDADLNDIASGLSNCITRDGQGKPTAAIDWNGQNLTGCNKIILTGTLAQSLNDNSGVSAAWAQTRMQARDNVFAASDTGAADAYAFALSPALTAYASGQEFSFVAANANTGAATTVNINALGTKAIKRLDGNDLVLGDILAGQVVKIVYDGTQFRLQNPAGKLSGTFSQYQVPVRQTVLSGPVDANGLPAFGGSTGSTTVTASGTLIATAANGSALSMQDRVGSITNPSWTGLSSNGTMYLYLDIAANNTCTTGSTTLAPVYQFGGSYSTANGQFTFNIQAMSGQVGNGSSAAQTYRVFVGEVTVASGVVTAITWYALFGRCITPASTPLPAVNVDMAQTHNIGVTNCVAQLVATCLTSELGYAVGDQAIINCQFDGNSAFAMPMYLTKKSVGARPAPGYRAGVNNRSAGGMGTPTVGNWSYQWVVSRGW